MKCVLSAIGGAISVFLTLVCIANFSGHEETARYEHNNYVSAIRQEECFLCGNDADTLIASHWGEDNVGILDLNSFEILYLEINRYDDHGELMTAEAGYMEAVGMKTENGTVHAYIHPDRGYANVQITGAEYEVDREYLQSRLCQNCLDILNNKWYSGDPPAEFAVVNVKDRSIEGMVTNKTGFSLGDFYVDCEYREDGKIDLLIFYCPNRLHKK